MPSLMPLVLIWTSYEASNWIASDFRRIRDLIFKMDGTVNTYWIRWEFFLLICFIYPGYFKSLLCMWIWIQIGWFNFQRSPYNRLLFGCRHYSLRQDLSCRICISSLISPNVYLGLATMTISTGIKFFNYQLFTQPSMPCSWLWIQWRCCYGSRLYETSSAICATMTFYQATILRSQWYDFNNGLRSQVRLQKKKHTPICLTHAKQNNLFLLKFKSVISSSGQLEAHDVTVT